MTEPPASAAVQPIGSLAMTSHGPNLVAPIRTYANSLIGFAEMLEDPEIVLSDAKRREYVDILRVSSLALERQIDLCFPRGRSAA